MLKYLEWIKDNWQESAVLVLIYVLVTLIPLYSRIETVELLLLLAFPLYLIHEIEEYILPGGFADFFNENILNRSLDNDIVPIDREAIFWINMIYIWLVIPFFSGLGFLNIKFAAWIPYFLIFQALSHLLMGIKGKMILNPGIRSSFLLHIPYSIIMIGLLKESGAFENVFFNLFVIIGFAFNGVLPLMAKFIILPRYEKRLSERG